MNMRVNSLIKSETLNSHITKMGLILSFNNHLLSFFFYTQYACTGLMVVI